NALRRPDNATIVVTHYQRLLNYIVPDFVHVLSNGRIAKSGGKELALELEEKGYDWLEAPAAGASRGARAWRPPSRATARSTTRSPRTAGARRPRGCATCAAARSTASRRSASPQ